MMDLYLHTEDNQILHQRFSAGDTIKTVEMRINPKVPIVILHNNQILVSQFSLKFYKINNGDHLFAFHQNIFPYHLQTRAQFFEQKFDQENKLESVRLKDIVYNKIDSTPQYYCKIVKRFNAIVDQENNIKYKPSNLPSYIPVKPHNISNAPLPKFW